MTTLRISTPNLHRVLGRGADTLVRAGTALEDLGRQAPAPATTCVVFLAVALLAAVLMLYRLGAAEVCGSNEAVEGLVVQQMIEHGSVLFPRLNGHDPAFKPPLFHWTATGLAYVLGTHEVSELALRLPSVLYGLGGVLLTMAFVRRWLGLSSAALAGLILLASYQYVAAARFGRVDMALTFCEALALFSFLSWLSIRVDADDAGSQAPRPGMGPRAAHYLLAGALALGVLAKGPVGTLLPLLAIGVLLLGERRWSDLRALGAPGPVLVLGALGSSWYLACLWGRHLDVIDRQIMDENLARFFGGLRTMPPWYYLKPLLLNSVPFSLLVPVAIVRALAPDRTRSRSSPRESLYPRLLALFWVVTVLFFSVAAYKRRAYLLPLWPPAAALLVWWLGTESRAYQRRWRHGAAVLACSVLIVFNLLFLPHAERAACGGARYRRAAAAIGAIVPRGSPLYLAGFDSEPVSLLFYLDRTVPPLPDGSPAPVTGYTLVAEAAPGGRENGAAGGALLTLDLDRRRVSLRANDPAQSRDYAADRSNRP